MSASLLDLIKQYGDARAVWASGHSQNYIPEALAKVEERIEAIRDAVYSVHGVDETVPDILDGTA